MPSKRKTERAIAIAACAAALAGLAWAASASAATWVIRGRAYGHGVGMSQYGAYGLAKHGRDYRSILTHYYRHTHVGHAGSRKVSVLITSGRDSVGFSRAKKACGKGLDPARGYSFDRSGPDVILRRSGGGKLKDCGGTGTAVGAGAIKISGQGTYRGKLRAKAAAAGLLVINVVGLEGYVKGVVPNEMPSSWSQAALRAQAVAARSYAIATSGSGPFDLYDDTRSQVYGGKDSETHSTNKASARTRGRVVRYHRRVATTYYFSTSGGRTESIEYGFPGADPVAYLKSVRDPYDGISPYHKWKLTYSQSQMESRLSGLFSGKLRQIDVLKRGDSPRIVRARVVGSSGSTKVTGPGLQSRLGLRSTWAHFDKR